MHQRQGTVDKPEGMLVLWQMPTLPLPAFPPGPEPREGGAPQAQQMPIAASAAFPFPMQPVLPVALPYGVLQPYAGMMPPQGGPFGVPQGAQQVPQGMQQYPYMPMQPQQQYQQQQYQQQQQQQQQQPPGAAPASASFSQPGLYYMLAGISRTGEDMLSALINSSAVPACRVLNKLAHEFIVSSEGMSPTRICCMSQ